MSESNDESFDLPVLYKGQELHFSTRLLSYGYTHKIQVEVNGIAVLLEPDEERNYRAVIPPEQEQPVHIDTGLLAAIVAAVEAIVK